MMRIKKTFTLTLPNTPAIPIDDANDLTLEIEDDQADESVGFETIKLEESHEIYDDEVEEADISGTDLDDQNPQEKKLHENQTELINYKTPVFKCAMEKCDFTTNVEKYLVFHLERHKLYDENRVLKSCRMCRTFKTAKYWELTNHRMICPSYEKLKKFCKFPDCTYVTFKLKQMTSHVEKYHSNTGIRNPFDKKKKSSKKRKNEIEAKGDTEKKLKTDEAEPQSNKDLTDETNTEQIKDKTEEQVKDKIEEQIKDKIEEKDASKMEDKDSDTDEEALKIDESYEEPVDNEQDEEERERIEEEAKRRCIDEQIENTINLLCDITKGNKEGFLQEPADFLPFKLESDGNVDLQMQENACISNSNSLLNSFL